MDDYTVETIECTNDPEGRAVRIRLVQETEDLERTNPRQWDGNLGILFTPHRRYDLGDHDRPEFSEAESALEHFTEYPSRGGVAAFERWLRIFAGATVVLPVGLIDHSGLSMYVGGGPHWSDGAGWDSGTVGVIFDLPKTRAAAGLEDHNVEQVRESLVAEVQAYDAHLRGDVLGYVVEREETWVKEGTEETRTDWEQVESVWGFLIADHDRDMAYLRGEAVAALPEGVTVKD